MTCAPTGYTLAQLKTFMFSGIKTPVAAGKAYKYSNLTCWTCRWRSTSR